MRTSFTSIDASLFCNVKTSKIKLSINQKNKKKVKRRKKNTINRKTVKLLLKPLRTKFCNANVSHAPFSPIFIDVLQKDFNYPTILLYLFFSQSSKFLTKEKRKVHESTVVLTIAVRACVLLRRTNRNG